MTHIIRISCEGQVLAKEFKQKVVVVFLMERKGRTQKSMRKKRKERKRGGTLQGYMTHIIKISCGYQVFAGEFREKVVVVFFMRKKRGERKRGDCKTHCRRCFPSGGNCTVCTNSHTPPAEAGQSPARKGGDHLLAPVRGTNQHFHPQPTRSCPPDPPRAWQALVVGMWKCSPPHSQHFNRLPFPEARCGE